MFKTTALLALSAALLGACAPLASSPSSLPPSLGVGNGPPEDITASGDAAYVSNFGDGSVLRLDLARGGAASVFVPPATDAYTAAWGLRVVPARNWLLSVQNRPYDFNPAHAQAGRVTAYDLRSGARIRSWDLPEGAVGNSVDVDPAGRIYVGDIGPNPRVVRIDPDTGAVTVWATSPQWVGGGFGIGGMVYGGGGLYAAHNNALWFIGLNADGSAAAPRAVKVEGDPAIFADGMTWTGNSLVYAENDVLTPGPKGAVYQVQFRDPLTATRAALHTGLRDPSGVTVAGVGGRSYLLVNESQLGYAFGVDPGRPSLPYQVRVFAR